jgi:hypothetical protein
MRHPKQLAYAASEVGADWATTTSYLWPEMQLTPRNIDHPLAKPSAPDETGVACNSICEFMLSPCQRGAAARPVPTDKRDVAAGVGAARYLLRLSVTCLHVARAAR